MTVGAPPKSATADFLDTLEKSRRLTGLQVNTLTLAVVDVDDAVGWARLTELGTSSTMTAQTTATTATTDLLNATLQAVDMVGDIASLPGIQPGRLASGRDVRGLFATTQDVVRNRMAGGAKFPDALAASAQVLTGVASSEPHRIGRDGQMNTGLADSRFDRFRRVAEAGACDWCRMLATRGAVYLTERSAGKGRAYHLPRDRCHVELVVSAQAIADSKVLSGDWRNAIRDEQRMVDAGAMDGVTTDARGLMATMQKTNADLAASGGWAPGKWESFDPAELVDSLPPHLSEAAVAREKLNALLSQGPRSRRKERPVVHAVRNGNKTVISTQKFTAAQMQGVLSDLDEAIAAIPAELRGNPVTLDIPVGDSHWKGRTGGYVIAGSPRIHLKPAIATGSERWPESEFHMPAAAQDRTRRDVIMHEMGHVVDGMRNTTGVLRSGAPKYSEDAFWAQAMDQMPAGAYSQKNVHEGFAEMFMQYHVGGPGSHPVADTYAARYRW